MILGVFLSASCFVTWGADEPCNPPLDVNYCRFSEDPTAYIGRRIRIRALYSYDWENLVLESPMCCSEVPIRMWAEWDAKLKPGSKRLPLRGMKGPGGFVLGVFEGRVDDQGAMSATFSTRFRLHVDRIDKIERSKRVRRPEDIPPWVPRNCGTSGVAPGNSLSH
jgi:hypothetical protein